MCLYVDERATARAIKSADEDGWIKFYKYYDAMRRPSNGRYFISSPFRRTYLNLSSNEVTVREPIRAPELYRGYTVHAGIHGLLSRPKLYGWRQSIVLVTCYGHVDDLIAAGDTNDIAFTKMYISPRDYKKLLDMVYGKGVYTYERAND